MFIDTHAHIYLDDFKEDLDIILAQCKQLSVDKILMPNIDSSSLNQIHHTEKVYPNQCVAMMGLHPCSVKENYQDELALVKSQLENKKYIGVGEIGIDLYWDKTTIEQQKEAFEYQIDLALEHELPIVIHSRDSLDLTIDTVKSKQNGQLKGIFHCFNGSYDQAKRIEDIGFYMGIGGVITFKNAGVFKTVSQLDLSHLVLETDAPYLSPTPYRGKRNSPEYIPVIAQKLAEILEVSLEVVAKATSDNAVKIFGESIRS